jgi:hypothetical protein
MTDPAYQCLGLPVTASPYAVLRASVRALHPDTRAVRGFRTGRKRLYWQMLCAYAARQAAGDDPAGSTFPTTPSSRHSARPLGRVFPIQEVPMADYFTHFSCLIDVGTPDKAARALALFEELRAADQDADDPEVAGFDLVRQDAPEGSTLWIHDDDNGDVEAVIRFVLRLADELDLTGLWGFQYALTCSRPRLDAFGGGAHVIDLGARTSVGWMSSQEWLAAALNGEDVDA